jgi:hypothetical protein
MFRACTWWEEHTWGVSQLIRRRKECLAYPSGVFGRITWVKEQKMRKCCVTLVVVLVLGAVLLPVASAEGHWATRTLVVKLLDYLLNPSTSSNFRGNPLTPSKLYEVFRAEHLDLKLLVFENESSIGDSESGGLFYGATVHVECSHTRQCFVNLEKIREPSFSVDSAKKVLSLKLPPLEWKCNLGTQKRTCERGVAVWRNLETYDNQEKVAMGRIRQRADVVPKDFNQDAKKNAKTKVENLLNLLRRVLKSEYKTDDYQVEVHLADERDLDREYRPSKGH